LYFIVAFPEVFGTSDVTLTVSVAPSTGVRLPTIAWHPATTTLRGAVVAGSVLGAGVGAGDDGGVDRRKAVDAGARATADVGVVTVVGLGTAGIVAALTLLFGARGPVVAVLL